MRIETIRIRNYRQFRNLRLSFDKRGQHDLHVIIGRNGTGKTNLLNAINWCLYGDEPHLSRSSQQLPLLNLSCIEHTESGSSCVVFVELSVTSDDGKQLVFKRRAEYTVHKDRDAAIPQLAKPESLEVRLLDDRGNTKLLSDEEAESCVERFVPKRLRDFFFFDGERLDNYFREATAQNIRYAVHGISQIDLLQRMENRLETVVKDLRKSAGKQNPRIDVARQLLEKTEGELAEAEKEIEESKTQGAIARSRIQEYEERLRAVPDVASLQKERDDLKEQREQVERFRAAKVKDKEALLVHYATILPLWDAIAESKRIISVKRQNREVPPPVHRVFLEKILKSKRCTICGRELGPESEERVKELLHDIRLSSDVAQQLMFMEPSLRTFEGSIREFAQSIGRVTKEIDRYESDLARIERRLGEIDRNLESYNVDAIREWHQKRKTFEHIRAQIQRRLGSLERHKTDLEKKVRIFDEQLDKELKREEKVMRLRRELDFCEKASKVARRTKETILAETRERLEYETSSTFLELLWKKGTFSGVEIGEDYDINVTHAMGYPCLGSLSAAERELLALSFTLALHGVSGFSSPILIDTPVARVSDVHRVNFASVLSEVSADRQIVLLFTPAEYSDDISGSLDQLASTRISLRLSSDETETSAEVL